MGILGDVFGGGGITGALGDIFGSSSKASSSKSGARKGTTTELLDISDEAIQGIIKDVLGSAEGLASIFGGEQATGLYSSSTAAQEAGDLTSKIVAEIAKLKAKKTTAEDYTETSKGSQGQGSGGLLGQAGSLVKGLF